MYKLNFHSLLKLKKNYIYVRKKDDSINVNAYLKIKLN